MNNMEQPNDASLIVELQSGELDALGILYERHKACVYRTALAITRDPSIAEDILQDCFLRLHRYAASIDSSLSLTPWLYRVTVNLAYSVEKRRKRWQIPLEWAIQRLVSPINHSPERQAEIRDTKNDVNDAIATLNINQRIVIILFYLNDLNLEEISNILACPVGTVKSRLHYGRQNLHRKLRGRYLISTNLATEFP